MPKGILQIVLPLLWGSLLLLAIVGLNAVLQGHFRAQQRCVISFSEIECEPPGKLSRKEFLDEVQYLANFPDELNLLDNGLAARLHLSFTAHPWVEQVERVAVTPPRQVRVLLRYHIPVLMVPPDRVVDGKGVLLPLNATDSQLPSLRGKVATPTGHPGQLWGDPAVEAVASLAAFLRPYQEQFKLTDFEIVDGSLILSNQHTRIVWGSISKDEVTRQSRLQALLELHSKRGSLDGWEIDVRYPDRPVVRPDKRL
jgi:hypothetical protein